MVSMVRDVPQNKALIKQLNGVLGNTYQEGVQGRLPLLSQVVRENMDDKQVVTDTCANVVGLMAEGGERQDYGVVLDLVKDTASTECANWKKNNTNYLDMVDQLL